MLINVLAGIELGHLSVALAQRLFHSILAATSAGLASGYHPHLRALCETVFDTPDDFQFQGPAPTTNRSVWMSLKHVDDLVGMIISTSGRDTAQLSKDLAVPVGSTTGGLDPDSIQRLVDTLSDRAQNLTFLLSGYPPPPHDLKRYPHAMRPGPVWFTKWCEFEDAFPHLNKISPSTTLAGAARDWLGLTYNQAPLIAIVTRKSVEPAFLHAHRPTVFDGINNPLYNHRVGHPDTTENLGRTLHVAKLRKVTTPATSHTLAGGAEVVGRDVWYNAQDFECVYLGKSKALNLKVEGELHPYMISPYANWDDVQHALLQQLRGP